jgi:hypothetical protein
MGWAAGLTAAGAVMQGAGEIGQAWVGHKQAEHQRDYQKALLKAEQQRLNMGLASSKKSNQNMGGTEEDVDHLEEFSFA